MKKRAIIWDWDNTLFDSLDAIESAWCAVWQHFGDPQCRLHDDESFAYRSAREVFPILFGKRSEEAAHVFHRAFLRSQRELHLMGDARDVLGRLHEACVPMGVVSNKEGSHLRHEIDVCRVAGYFGVVVGSGDLKSDKPDPQGIIYAAGALCVPIESVWYIGDSYIDVQAAQRAGCTSVTVHQHETPRWRGDYVCDDLKSVYKLWHNESMNSTAAPTSIS